MKKAEDRREKPIANTMLKGSAAPTVVAELWEVGADAVAAVVDPVTVDTAELDAVGMAVGELSPLMVRGAPAL